MQIFHRFQECHSKIGPAVLTIGNFDGVHQGHQKVIQAIIASARQINGKAIIISFRNHPLEVLCPKSSVKRLCTVQQKEKILENCGVDILFHLRFTKKFSEQTPETFLRYLQTKIDFKKMILGYDAAIGKEKKGDKNKLFALSHRLGFDVEYLNPFYICNTPVSSSRIRNAVKKGNLKQASQLLGRPFSIVSSIISGNHLGELIGYPTANLGVGNLCLPPYGIYTVYACFNGRAEKGVASLGVAPTLRESGPPILEVYLLQGCPNLYGKEMEVIFSRFLRPEIKFSSIEELKRQIERDVRQARAYS